jgi:signal transduction histidine kinase
MNSGKADLLEAAERVLQRDRIAGVTLAGVAAEAGVGVEEVERCFGDPASLLHELGIHGMVRLAETVNAAVGTTRSGEQALDTQLRTMVDVITENLEGFRLGMHARQVLPELMGRLPPELGKRYVSAGRALYDTTEAKIVEDWGDEMLPYGVHPRQLAFVAGLLVMGLGTMKGLMEASGGNITHSDEALVNVMSEMICSPPRMIRQLVALNAASRELARATTEQALLERVPRVLIRALDFSRVQVLMDVPGEQLRHASAVWGSAEEEKLAMQVIAEDRLTPPPHFRRAIVENRTIHLPSPADDPEWPKLDGPGAEQIMRKLGFMTPTVITPVRVQGQAVGVLVGHTHLRWRPMDEQDISRVEAFAAMVGIALENVRMLENLEAMVDERTRELRDAQAALVQSEKMASMGQLVAGVAHELNTPVGAVASAQDSLRKCAEKLSGLLGEDADPRVAALLRAMSDSAEVVSTGSERIDAIVKRLRSFARLDEASLQQSDVHDCVDAAIALLEHTLGGGVTLERHYGDLPTLRCDPRKLNQLFANLLANAVDAVGSDGCIGVKTRVDGSQVEVSITDDGAGIAPEHLSKVFDPGFTTKGVGVGAGLGLSIAFRIAEEHGGSIVADSAIGEGTTMTVLLPRG